MEELTPRQSGILQFLVEYTSGHGYPPTIREIRDAFELKSNRGVVDHLRSLERKGYIRRVSGSSRAIEILHRREEVAAMQSRGDGAVRYPVAGRIAAGRPAPPLEDAEESLLIDCGLFRERGDFMLEVRGDSMIEDHILSGDLLVVKKTRSCENGDIVVALVDGEATVKRFFREGEVVVLHPSNPSHEPITLRSGDSRNCSLLGRVIGVIRRLAPRGKPFSG